MKRSSLRGNSSFETIIVLIIVGIFALGIVGKFASCACSGDRRANANTEARQYVRTMHPGWTRPVISCQGMDTDGNGYVTCTVGDGTDRTEAIECAAFVTVSFNEGCRPMRYGMPANTNQ